MTKIYVIKLYQFINKRHLNPSLAVLIFYFNIGIVRWMWILYSWHHRVGRVQSFFSVVGIGTPPKPHPQGSVFPLPPPGSRGEGHTRWRERGLGEYQFRRGDIQCGTVLFIYTYFVVGTMGVNRAGTGRGCLAWQPYLQVAIDI